MPTRGEVEGDGMGDDLDFSAPVLAVPFLAKILTETAARPEHRALDRLVGTWTTRTLWQVVGGQPWEEHHGAAENRWALGGRVVESCTYDARGNEGSRAFLAFDPTANDYIAFSMSILSTFFVLERGSLDPDEPRIVFEGVEELPGSRVPIRFHRTITFVSDDELTVAITYPDHPNGPFGGMFIEHRRTGA